MDFLQSFSPLVHSSSFLLACNSNLPIPEAIEISFGSYSSCNHLFVLQTCHRDVALFHLLDSHELLSPSVQKGKMISIYIQMVIVPDKRLIKCSFFFHFGDLVKKTRVQLPSYVGC